MNEEQKQFVLQLVDEKLSTFLVNNQYFEAVELLRDATLAGCIDVSMFDILLSVFRSMPISAEDPVTVKESASSRSCAESDSYKVVKDSHSCKECKKLEKHSRFNKNQQISDLLDSMVLSRKARDIINQTDFDTMDECFGSLNTPADVELFIAEYYDDDI